MKQKVGVKRPLLAPCAVVLAALLRLPAVALADEERRGVVSVGRRAGPARRPWCLWPLFSHDSLGVEQHPAGMFLKAELGEPLVVRYLDTARDPGNTVDDFLDGNFPFTGIETFGTSVVQQFFVGFGDANLVAQVGVVEPLFRQAI